METYISSLILVTCLFLRLETTLGLKDGSEMSGKNERSFNTPESLFRRRRLLQVETTEASSTTAAPASLPDKDIITKINEFYSDKNNMAMFCVLPVMVLIYGGCCVIYCVAKCRRYLRRRKRRPLSHDDAVDRNNDDRNDLSRHFISIPPSITETPKPFMPHQFPESVEQHNKQPNVLASTAPPTAIDQSPLPWLTKQEPMVPPIASYPPQNSRDPSSRQSYQRDEKRRDYRDLLRIKPAYSNEGFEDQERPRIPEAHSLKSSSEIDVNTNSVDSGRESVMSYKEELLARYDALASFTMARNTATILKTGNVEHKQKKTDADVIIKKSKQKMVFIAE